MTASNPPKPKRRWYQFSLRTLIVLLIVSCVAFGGWLQFMRYRARTNRARVAAVKEAVDWVESMGGVVYTEDLDGRWLWADPKYEQLRPQTWLERLFEDPGGPDDPVGVLNVSTVGFRDIRLTDAGLEHLKGLPNLVELYLENTNVTDAGLEHLKGLKNLEYLYLDRTKVTDAGLKHLKGLTKLKELALDNTKVTHAGLVHLKGLPKLRHLNIKNTNVTAAGVKKLQQALPNCKIIHDPLGL